MAETDDQPSDSYSPPELSERPMVESEAILNDEDEASRDVTPNTAMAPSIDAAGDLFAGLSLSATNRGEKPSAAGIPDVAIDHVSEELTADDIQATNDENETKMDVDLSQSYDLTRSPTPVASNVSSPSPIPESPKMQKKNGPPLVIRKPSINLTEKSGEMKTNVCASPVLRKFTVTTRVPHPDTCLRLLRKFYSKAAPFIPKHLGGTKPTGWFGWVFGSSVEAAGNTDSCWLVFHDFSKCLEVEKENRDESKDSDEEKRSENQVETNVIVESILGHRGDSHSKARSSLSAFIQLVLVWCHASEQAATFLKGNEEVEGKVGVVTSDLLALVMDTSCALVAHGCLDEVYLEIDSESTEQMRDSDQVNSEEIERDKNIAIEDEFDAENASAPMLIKKAVNILAESVFIIDLSKERTELSAIKFLLTTGCRVATNPETNKVIEPMLHGSHLLQAIRVCYHVYLNTGSTPNKTTAKAALQQISTSVFIHLERAIENVNVQENTTGLDNDEKMDNLEDERGKMRSKSFKSSGISAFPTQDHRDAYLVLRSLCKLSIQNKSHSSSSVRGSTAPELSVDNSATEGLASTAVPNLVSTSADDTHDPSFESRILALELLQHILRHPSALSILHAGPEFNYAIRQYLCTSLLKNTTSVDTTIVELSLRLFVPLIRHFRSLLKTEIEAFVTNVFFVILDSKNSTVQHKMLVVTLFEEICSDPTTLADIFLNYDCDLSAVDLFQRIVNALGKVARVGLTDATGSGTSSSLQYVAGAGAIRAEKKRQDHRDLRLSAMKALRQVLASLHSSIVTQVKNGDNKDISIDEASEQLKSSTSTGVRKLTTGVKVSSTNEASTKKTLVEMYDSKKKRKEEESQAALKFNLKPAAGLKFAAERGLLDGDDPVDVARYLLQNKDILDKAQIGDYLGREKEWQDGFALKVLRAYGQALDFKGMPFDDAIRYYLSGFRLPGEAQKIDRIMEVFAARYTEQNISTFPNADSAFILAFSIIMLNTDLHNPAIKEDRKMTIQSFQRMNSGVCDGGDFPDEMLADIFNRIKSNPISLKEDDDARENAGIKTVGSHSTSALTTSGLGDFFFGSHYLQLEKAREDSYQKEGAQIVRDTESILKRKRKANKHGIGKHNYAMKTRCESYDRVAPVKFVGTADSGLKDEYVTPMFDVTWGPALAVFSTAIESANGTDGIFASIATEGEMDLAIENASLAIETSLNGFQLAICIAGLCGNNTARDAYVRALYNFTLLGTGRLIADRNIQCVQLLLRLGKDDGELLGVTWEHIFRALSEISRLHQVWEGMARNERKEIKAKERLSKGLSETTGGTENDQESDSDSDSPLEDEMDKHMIDEANAISIHDEIPPNLVDSIFLCSSSLSRPSLREFVYQLCRISRMEISGYGGHVGSDANDIDLSNDHYLKRHALVTESKNYVARSQPAIYSLQKLIEVTHFNMESRPRLIFSDIWGTVSIHLTSTALHDEAAVAMYAVDSLRQLSMQFLSRDELGVFEFQRRFLIPLETIMSKSTHVNVKELLLSAVEQLILNYGFDEKATSLDKSVNLKQERIGTLRSGWRSVLNVIGMAGIDKNDSIAIQGFKLLQDQIQHCISTSNKEELIISSKNSQDLYLLSEHFIDLVNALLLYVSGPRQDLSSKSVDNLLKLSDLLADEKISLKSTSRKSTPWTSVNGSAVNTNSASSTELEFWWPMLLGLSQTIGDRRHDVRIRGLSTLFGIINKHFFPHSGNVECNKTDDLSPRHGDLQTLQLIFRGILVPTLEFEEIDGNSTSGFAPELLPPKFIHFITLPPDPDTISSQKNKYEWINTTFEHLIDGCVSLCLKSLEIFGSDSLVVEMLAMLNSCLLSDSGHLAVKGLRRLQNFVTKDLKLKYISEDTWETVSHMLVRVLSVRALPVKSIPESDKILEKKKEMLDQEQLIAIDEFIREQQFFSNRRYIGCNAAMVIGSLLTNDKIVKCMGIRWYIFLISGLGQGIKEWEIAAKIMDSKSINYSSSMMPPHYMENVLYGRKWITKFLLNLIVQNETSTLETPTCQHVLKEETESLVKAFLVKETNESCSVVDMRNMSKMISDLFDCFHSLSDEKIATMNWLSLVLSKCIQTNDVTIRASVQILLTRLLDREKSSKMTNKKVNIALKLPAVAVQEEH